MKRSINLPNDLDAIISTLAKDEGRTRSGQIAYMLRQALKAGKGRK
jgi:hypothetical protein